MKKRFLAMLLALLMVLGMVPGAVFAAEPEVPCTGANGCAAKSHTALCLTAPVRKLKVNGTTGTLRLFYDDYFQFDEYTVSAITDKGAESKQVGFDVSTEAADTAVLTEKTVDGTTYYVATGTGEATVTLVGQSESGPITVAVTVTVEPAPISLVTITGYSIGEGTTGDANQSVVCEYGQAYSSHGGSALSVENAAGYIPGALGSGENSKQTSTGTPASSDLHAFAANGKGTHGEGSALARQWNQLTGEKVWVLNAAHGGTNLVKWVPGGIDYEQAKAMFEAAEETLLAEIAAGHYTLKHNIVIFHGPGNGDQNYTFSKYDTEIGKMLKGFKNDFTVGEHPLDCVGLNTSYYYTTSGLSNGSMIQYYLAATEEGEGYPTILQTNRSAPQWASDSGVADWFETQYPSGSGFAYTSQGGEVTAMPATVNEVVLIDKIHYTQAGYNERGREIARTLYQYFRTEPGITRIGMMKTDGKTLYTDGSSIAVSSGGSVVLTPYLEPLCINDVTIETTGGVTCTDHVTYTAASDGDIVLKRDGVVVCTVHVTVGGDDVLNEVVPGNSGRSKWYRWDFGGDSNASSTSKGDPNSLTLANSEFGSSATTGTTKFDPNTGEALDAVLKLGTPFVAAPNKNWAVEFTTTTRLLNADAVSIFLSEHGQMNKNEPNSITLAMGIANGNQSSVGTAIILDRNGSSWHNYITTSEAKTAVPDLDITKLHTYRIEHTKGADGGAYAFYLDGKFIGTYEKYGEGTRTLAQATYPKDFVNDLSDRTVAYPYVGAWSGNPRYFNGTISSILLAEDSSTVSFDLNGGAVEGGAIPALTTVNRGARTSPIFVEDTVTLPSTVPTRGDHAFIGWKDGESETLYPAGGSYIVSAVGGITLTAQWIPTTPVTITFELYDGGDASTLENIKYGDTVEHVSLPIREGYHFLGYFDAKEGGKQYFNSEGDPMVETWDRTEDTTLYARWAKKDKIYAVTFQDGDGATGGPVQLSFRFGDEIAVLTAVPTREGYQFKGYFDAQSGGTQYYNGTGWPLFTEWTRTEDLTLYARWEKVLVPITLNGVPVSVRMATADDKVPNSWTGAGATFDPETGKMSNAILVLGTPFMANMERDWSMEFVLTGEGSATAMYPLSTTAGVNNGTIDCPADSLKLFTGTGELSYMKNHVKASEYHNYFTVTPKSVEITYNFKEQNTYRIVYRASDHTMHYYLNGRYVGAYNKWGNSAQSYSQANQAGTPYEDGVISQKNSLYRFIGSGNGPITGTLHALRMADNSSSLHFDLNCGTMASSAAITAIDRDAGQDTDPTSPIFVGDTIDLTDYVPTRANYTFKGWQVEGDGTLYGVDGHMKYPVTTVGAITLVAQWEGESSEVTLNHNGGSGSTERITATFGAAMPAVDPPVNGNQKFLGYFTEQTGGTQYYLPDGTGARAWGEANVTTLYAQWAADITENTVTFNNGEGATGGQSVSIACTYGEAVTATVSVPVRTGYTFEGYFDAETGGTKYFDKYGAAAVTTWNRTQDTTLYARWTANRYTVSFDMGGQGSARLSPITVTYGEALPAISAIPTKTGYVFAGAYTAENGGGTQHYDKHGKATAAVWNIAQDTTLYIHWTGETYTVTLNGNGGTSSSVAAVYGAGLPPAGVPTRAGYNFVGYFDTSAASGGTKYYDDRGTGVIATWNVTANSTLYARWTPATFTVILDNGEGTGGVGSIQATYTKTMEGLSSLPTQSGYNFAGYFDGTDGAGKQYFDHEGRALRTWDKPSDTTLHAYWVENRAYTVSFSMDNGSVQAPADISVRYNGAMPKLTVGDIPDKNGMAFMGFIDAADGKMYYDASGNPLIANWDKINDITLTAVYGRVTINGTPVTVTMATGTFGGWTGSGAAYKPITGEMSNAILKLSQNFVITLDEDWSVEFVLTAKGNAVIYPLSAAAVAAAGTAQLPYDSIKLFSNGELSFMKNVSKNGTYHNYFAGTPSGYQHNAKNTYRMVYKASDHSLHYYVNGTYVGEFDHWGSAAQSSAAATNPGKPYEDVDLLSKTSTFQYIGHGTGPVNGTLHALSMINQSSTIAFDLKDGTMDSTTISTIDRVSGSDTDPASPIFLGDAVDLSDYIPTREGYVFQGWKDSSGNTYCTGESHAENKNYIIDTTGAITLTAQWKAKTYTITLNGNGATTPGTASVTATYDSSVLISAIDAPTKTGYTFGGWTATENGDDVVINENGALVTAASGYTAGGVWKKDGDVTLHAKWVANDNTAYKVEHYQQNVDGNGYSLMDIENKSGTTGGNAVATNKTYTGFTYRPDAEGTVASGSIMADGSLVLKLYYTRNQYTLKFDANGGENGSETQVYYGAAISAPTVTKTGHAFDEWNTAVAATMPAQDVTYTAQWTANTYTITYVGIEGATVATKPIEHTYGVTTSVSDAAKSGYTFNGWMVNGGEPQKDLVLSATGYTDNITLTADWTAVTPSVPSVPSIPSGPVTPPAPTTTTETVTNPDGSVTTTVTNKTTGTVTETTKQPSGAALTVETKKDGTQSISVTVPANVDSATFTIPVEDVKPGTVVKDAATGEVMKFSVATEDGLTVRVDGNADLVIVDNSKTYVDTEDHWAEDAIHFVSSRELYQGVGNDIFAPKVAMTRGMLAQVLHNLESNPDHAFDGSFSDLKDTWYTEAILWAADKGIVNGVPGGAVEAERDITREEMVVMLWRYAGRPDSDHDLSGYGDSGKIGSYAELAFAWANELGVINGKPGNLLDPKGTATRAEVAQMMMNFMNAVLK